MLMRHVHPTLQFTHMLPYGAILHENGVQFVVYSRSATAMRLLLYDNVDDPEPDVRSAASLALAVLACSGGSPEAKTAGSSSSALIVKSRRRTSCFGSVSNCTRSGWRPSR